jgi:F-type H+-transporting ATPase subunit b
VLEFPPDITFVYQAVLILVLWAILKRLAFDRFLHLGEERHARTAGALEAARRRTEEAATLEAEYAKALAEARRGAAEAREAVRRQAEKEEREILEAARAEAAETLASIRARIAEQEAAARAALEREVASLAEEVLRSLTGGRS